MKTKINTYIGLLALLLTGNSIMAQTPTSTQNYIMETVVKHQGHKTTASLTGLPVDSANRTISYFDGLGRPLQTVQWQGSPEKRDIVSYSVYDALGREAVKYLPYADSVGNDGSYRVDAAAKQASFYGSGSWDANIAKTPYPYSRTVFEASPLNRVLEQGAPGAVWQPYSGSISGSGHTVATEYGLSGADQIRIWTVSGTGASVTGTYGTNTLYKTRTGDENGNGTWTYTDKQGRVIRKVCEQPAETYLATTYIYDDYGNLRYVLPPGMDPDHLTGFTEQDAVFKNFAYAYHYDGRKRVIEKKVPGRGWEHLVYNKLDQVVLAQDSVMRAGSKWRFTKYDALGRVIVTGIVTSSSDRATWQSSVDAQSVLWETRDNANSNGTYVGYTNLSLPTGPFYNYYTINYYDDYGFYGNPFGQPVSPQSAMVRGLPTATRSLIIGDGAMPYTVMYYDEKGRVVTTKSQNHLGGTDVVDNAYGFTGELTASTRTHVANSATTTIANSYTYDHMGRKISTKDNINNQGDVWLNKLEYNGIGQLKAKNLHSTNGSTYLQNTKYSYNERGWMKGSTSAEFSIKLGYDTLSNPQYNGNISTQLWGSGSTFPNRFDYQYDKLNRLTNGTTSSGISMGEVLSYDVMGNIATMNRDGAGTATYSYSGNQLTGISGGGLTTGSYAYDGNGNTTTDGRTGATVAYNQLNLPASFTKSSPNPIALAYTYDATGRKLKKVNGTTSTTTDYVNGIQYTNGSIEFIQTEEGRAQNNSGTYSYQYDLKDHLGNVRYSFDIYAGTVRKLQADDYYAFGLRHSVTAGTNNYLYNAKELQDELGQYDYGARFYDPVVGRWNSVDPLAEKSFYLTPYRYGFNNPVRFLDPNGAYETDGHFWTVYLMATLMGRNDAFRIAFNTEVPDNIMNREGEILSSPSTWMDRGDQRGIHALNGGPSNLARAYGTAWTRTARTYGSLGEALHYLGDSYAHSVMGDEGTMYPNGRGHLFDWHAPDKIANRPDLYRQYVNTLSSALGDRLGFKGSVDMFTFDYVANSGGSTEQNSAVFEAEIRLREGSGSFSVGGNQLGAINNYMKSRNNHYGTNTSYKAITTNATTYKRNGNGEWYAETEEKTFVTFK